MVLVPQINVDGFASSRGTFDPGDSLFGQDPNVTLGRGGRAARRPVRLLWGGPGSSSDVTSQSYHGLSPRSEVEVRAVWDYARTHHVTSLVSVHNVAALVLRPPGLSDGWQLCDTAGTTEDDTYAATGGYGYTIEMGPPDGQFHMPYETGVVAEWTGDNDHSRNAGGLREGLLPLAEAAVSERDHAVFEGGAPAGTRPAPAEVVQDGDESLLPEERRADRRRLRPRGPAPDWGDAAARARRRDRHDDRGRPGRALRVARQPVQDRSSAAGRSRSSSPTSSRRWRRSPAPPPSRRGRWTTTSSRSAPTRPRTSCGSRSSPRSPEDYDIEVVRREGDQLKPLGSSGNLPGESEEVILDRPPAGRYVVRVAYYAAATGTYEVEVVRAVAQRTVTTGGPEAYTLTCERADGTVPETHELIIARGERVAGNLGCGAGPATTADGSPLAAGPITARTAPAGSPTRLRLGPVRLARRGVRAAVICPFAADGDCRGGCGRSRASAGAATLSGASRSTVARPEPSG